MEKGGNIIKSLLSSRNPIVQYKTRKLLLNESEESARMVELRKRIRNSNVAKMLLSHVEADGTIKTNPYRKWQGPHWTLFCLAQIEYPKGDPRLVPLRDQVYAWLLEKKHLVFPRSLLIPGQENRFRRCATQEGAAIWYSIKLGIDDDRTRELVKRLIRWQWPDGGWNCDKRTSARTSSVIESLIPLRALHLAGRYYNDKDALECSGRTAEYFLKRRLFKRLHDGKVIHPAFMKIQYPIQFYDVLFALLVMVETDRIHDDRCADALDLLASKQLPDGGFALELKNAVTSDELITRGTYADWGASGRRIMNEYVTIDALYALNSANARIN
jgi:hypothetical protein